MSSGVPPVTTAPSTQASGAGWFSDRVSRPLGPSRTRATIAPSAATNAAEARSARSSSWPRRAVRSSPRRPRGAHRLATVEPLEVEVPVGQRPVGAVGDEQQPAEHGEQPDTAGEADTVMTPMSASVTAIGEAPWQVTAARRTVRTSGRPRGPRRQGHGGMDRELAANAATQAASQVTGSAPPSRCVRVQNTATATDVSATSARLKVTFRIGERRWPPSRPRCRRACHEERHRRGEEEADDERDLAERDRPALRRLQVHHVDLGGREGHAGATTAPRGRGDRRRGRRRAGRAGRRGEAATALSRARCVPAGRGGHAPARTRRCSPRAARRAWRCGSCGHQPRSRSAAGIGRLRCQPWPRSQPIDASRFHVTVSSMPSATTSSPRCRPRSTIARTMATSSPPSRSGVTKLRSIFTSCTGSR